MTTYNMTTSYDMTTLFSLAEGIRRCTACPLWKSRTLAVPGEGPRDAKIMFVGEAPGREEDRVGLPFVGRSGKFLDEMLVVAGLKRNEVFITGACKCRPPQNRTPTTQELLTCHDLWLKRQIEIIKPEIVVVMGTSALYSLLGKKEIGKLRGKIIAQDDQRYFVTYHPAAGMRFPKIKKMMKLDFEVLKKWKNIQ